MCTLTVPSLNVAIANSFEEVRTLNLVQVPFPDIPQRIIELFPPLEKLDLSSNKFTALKFDDIHSNTLSNVSTLIANHNNITAIYSTTFAKTPLLRYLSLQHNQIQYISGSAFHALPELRGLYLLHNHLKSITHNNIFGLNTKLNYLFLNNNHLMDVHTSFQNLSWLTVHLSHNPIESMELNFGNKLDVFLNVAYCGLKKYTITGREVVLNLNGNQLEELRVTKGSRLEQLRLSHNRIHNLDIDPRVPLEVLELANNSIQDIGPLLKIVTLRSLDVSQNPLPPRLPSGAFTGLNRLSNLSLRRTGVKIIDEYWNEGHPLTVLDLSENNYGEFDLSLLWRLNNLKSLLLHSNRLKTINRMDMVWDMTELRKIGLSNNSFSCGYLAELVDKFRSHRVELIVPVELKEFQAGNVNGVQCHCSNGDLSGKEMVPKSDADAVPRIESESVKLSTVIGLGCVIMILLTIIGWLIFRERCRKRDALGRSFSMTVGTAESHLNEELP